MGIYSVEIWLIIGVICIILEFSSIPGIGFLFLGFGALTTSALIAFNADIGNYQYAVFGILSLAWFLILLKPLKSYLSKKKGKGEFEGDSFDIIGKRVIVIDHPIKPGQIGQVKWSGTVMNASLKDLAEEVQVGTILKVVEIKGNILICIGK